MEAKFKLNEEVLIFKEGKNQLATIIERKLIKDLDTNKTEIKYFYTIPSSIMSHPLDEDMLVLLNQFALRQEVNIPPEPPKSTLKPRAVHEGFGSKLRKGDD